MHEPGAIRLFSEKLFETGESVLSPQIDVEGETVAKIGQGIDAHFRDRNLTGGRPRCLSWWFDPAVRLLTGQCWIPYAVSLRIRDHPVTR